MALFEWQDDYSVKVPSIDAQHRTLVQMLNELHDGMTGGAAAEVLSSLLDRLADYTVKHFAYEEELFAQTGFPQAPQHIAEHQALVAKVVALKAKHAAHQVSITMDLMRFLKDWLIRHILGSDKAYSGHLVERGVK